MKKQKQNKQAGKDKIQRYPHVISLNVEGLELGDGQQCVKVPCGVPHIVIFVFQ